MSTTAPRPARLRIGAIVAAIVLPAIIVVVLVLLFQRRIVSGLTNGAVKG